MTGPDIRQPWDDAALHPDRRASLLLAELDLDQKLAQVQCLFPRDITDLADVGQSVPHGIGVVSGLEIRTACTLDEVSEFQRRVQEAAMAGSGHAIPAIFHMEGLCGAFLPGGTSFPAGIGRGASWDADLEERVGEVVGRQERALGITHTFAPVLDVARDPRMGRYGETYGEDPTLVSALGVAYTRGVQGEGPGTLRTEAVAKHFVASHHVEAGIHGAHADISRPQLLETYAAPFQAAITLAGLRGIMPCYSAVAGEPATASRWLLTTLLREEMGFDGLVVSDYSAVSNLHTTQRVAESLPHAGLAALRAGMDVEQPASQAFGPELRDWFRDGRADQGLLDVAVHRVLAAKFRMGLFENPFAVEAQQRDRIFHSAADGDLTLRAARESMVLLRNDGVLPLQTGVRRIAVIGSHAATARSFFGGYTHYSLSEALLASRSSMAGIDAIADHPGGATLPGSSVEPSDAPAYEELLHQQQPRIRNLLEELRDRLPQVDVVWSHGYPVAGTDTSGYDDALAVAADADMVILTLGGKYGMGSIVTTGEGVDATDVGLPPCQEGLIVRLAQLGVPLVGVHLDGRPISSDVADSHLSALVEAWAPAEAGARAIVDVLTGAVNPSGRLPVSVARSAGQVPLTYRHPWGSAWHQGESIGFPEYVDAPHTPRYAFGHGLSYTTFTYSGLEVPQHPIAADGVIDVSFTVTNIGPRPGTEVVQLYLTDRYASMSRPVLQLAGFRRVDLDPGQDARIEFQVRASQLAFLDADSAWRVEAGEVDVHVGASSQDLRLEGTVRITEDARVDGARRGFYAESTVRP